MNSSNQVKSKIMKQAWVFAKSAAAHFGGKASQYISGSLKMVWAKINEVVIIKHKSIKINLDDFRSQIKSVSSSTSTMLEVTMFDFCRCQILGLIG